MPMTKPDAPGDDPQWSRGDIIEYVDTNKVCNGSIGLIVGRELSDNSVVIRWISGGAATFYHSPDIGFRGKLRYLGRAEGVEL